jgi:DNA-binding GntR family transcriptional regulator
MRAFLQIENLIVIESLRGNFVSELSLQTIDESLKADLRIEFERWLNEWTAEAYREGVIAVSPVNGSVPASYGVYPTS